MNAPVLDESSNAESSNAESSNAEDDEASIVDYKRGYKIDTQKQSKIVQGYETDTQKQSKIVQEYEISKTPTLQTPPESMTQLTSSPISQAEETKRDNEKKMAASRKEAERNKRRHWRYRKEKTAERRKLKMRRAEHLESTNYESLAFTDSNMYVLHMSRSRYNTAEDVARYIDSYSVYYGTYYYPEKCYWVVYVGKIQSKIQSMCNADICMVGEYDDVIIPDYQNLIAVIFDDLCRTKKFEIYCRSAGRVRGCEVR